MESPTQQIPTLRPEWADTVEIDVERKLGKRMNLQASAYGYQLHDLSGGRVLPGRAAAISERRRDRGRGVELEINGRPANWLEATASYALQRSRDNSSGGVLENSPRTSGQAALRGAAGAEIRPQ